LLKGANVNVHYMDMVGLLLEAAQAVRQDTTVITIPTMPRLVVVGDLHGSLQDLCHILTLHAPQDEGNAFVFDGDFVDRGNPRNSTGVIAVLCVLKILYPKQVFLVRGNHECALVCAHYIRELQQRYGMLAGEKLRYLSTQLFAWLPIAAVYQDAFICHGCVPAQEGVTVEELNAVPRGWPICPMAPKSLLESMPECIPPLECLTERQRQISHCLMWNDVYGSVGPMSTGEPVRGNRGTDGDYVVSGSTIQDFLDRAGLRRVIRAHEILPGINTEEGYKEEFGGRCITLFSQAGYMPYTAPDGSRLSSRAAIAVMEGGVFKITTWSEEDRLVSYESCGSPKGRPDGVHSVCPSTFLAGHVAAQESTLLKEFQREDEKANGGVLTGSIQVSRWAEIMAATLPEISLDWDKTKDALEVANPVDYATFLRQMKASISEDEIQRRLLQTLGPLQLAFHLADVDNDGKVTRQELDSMWELAVCDIKQSNNKEGWEALLGKDCVHVDTVKRDLDRIFEALDQNGDGYIGINEFCEANPFTSRRLTNIAQSDVATDRVTSGILSNV